MEKKTILSLLLLIMFVFAGCAQSYVVEIPKDFKVIAIAGGVAPGTSVFQLEIDAEGNCVYSKMEGGNKTGDLFQEIERFKIPPQGVEFIYRTAKDNKFFDLAKEYKNSNILDGSFAKLTVTVGGKIHTVTTQNIKVDRFDNIMIAINITTPGMNKVMYNAINE